MEYSDLFAFFFTKFSVDFQRDSVGKRNRCFYFASVVKSGCQRDRGERNKCVVFVVLFTVNQNIVVISPCIYNDCFIVVMVYGAR